MKKTQIKNTQNNAFFKEIFEHNQDGLCFQDAQEIRYKVIEFLSDKDIPKKVIDNINLSITEILSNLVKHPTEPISFLKLHIKSIEDHIILDIADDSPPFNNFNAEITKAQKTMYGVQKGKEDGYGLGLITRVNQKMTYIPSHESDDRYNHFIATQRINSSNIDRTGIQQNQNPLLFIIDDDSTARKLYTKILEEKYEVMSFDHAQDAVNAFSIKKPDLIISDLMMPEMNGIDLRKKLSELDGGDTTPFIFISADRQKEDNAYIDDLGIDDFLCKPIKAERLQHVVFRLLKRSQQIRHSLQHNFDADITQLLEPSVPQTFKGYKFDLAYAIAEAGGGDFITHKLDDDKLTLVLADVMGHGRKAKFFSYIYAGYINSIFRVNAPDHNASEILQFLSKSINNDRLLEDVILTCQCVQLFPNGKVELASAGHPYPILIRNDENTAELIHIEGALPGLISNNTYNLLPIELEQGDKLIFMTDGFLEAFDKTERSTLKVLKIISENIHLSTPDLLNTIWTAYEKIITDPLTIKDDATVIIIEYNEEP